MVELVLLVMLVAIVLYAVFGGADFGVGMIEPFLSAEQRTKLESALLPVWEANHVWLVLAAVIAFVAFPPAFGAIATYLHIPILCLLLGIVARGSAFTFRHYDPASTQESLRHVWYSWVFCVSSVFAPLFLGVIAGALVQGSLPSLPGAYTRGSFSDDSFYTLFVAPWNTPLCWLTGVFTCALFAFEGAALLAAEQGLEAIHTELASSQAAPIFARAPEGALRRVARATEGGLRPVRLPLLKLTRRLHLAAIIAGFCVLAWVWFTDLPWSRAFFTSPVSLSALVVATLLIPAVAWTFTRAMVWPLRLATGAQMSAVLVGGVGAHYPVLLRFAHGQTLRVSEAAAPSATLRTLLIALGIGLALIGPSLVYLLKVFKGQPATE